MAVRTEQFDGSSGSAAPPSSHECSELLPASEQQLVGVSEVWSREPPARELGRDMEESELTSTWRPADRMRESMRSREGEHGVVGGEGGGEEEVVLRSSIGSGTLEKFQKRVKLFR